MTEKLTIYDIARMAGVSYGTVSRVINNMPRVSQDTRERVLRIMEEHGYVASMTASGLARRKSQLIGVLVPFLTWPFIAEIVGGATAVAEARGYEIVLYSAEHKDYNAVIDRMMATMLTSGVLAIHMGQSVQYISKLYEMGFPAVMCTDQIPASEIPCPWTGSDNRAGAYEAVKHLVQLGYRRIAHIYGPTELRCSHDRYQGYCDALQEVGIAPDSALVVYGNFQTDGGSACARQLFALPERPEAIFASNDDMAYGVMRVAEEQGVRIPEDVALVGFDDIPFSDRLRPSLTTVRQPFFDMGQQATEILISLIEEAHAVKKRAKKLSNEQAELPTLSASDSKHVLLPTRLIVRASCGSASKGT